jgi:hypothetical protein
MRFSGKRLSLSLTVNITCVGWGVLVVGVWVLVFWLGGGGGRTNQQARPTPITHLPRRPQDRIQHTTDRSNNHPTNHPQTFPIPPTYTPKTYAPMHPITHLLRRPQNGHVVGEAEDAALHPHAEVARGRHHLQINGCVHVYVWICMSRGECACVSRVMSGCVVFGRWNRWVVVETIGGIRESPHHHTIRHPPLNPQHKKRQKNGRNHVRHPPPPRRSGPGACPCRSARGF